MKNGWILLLLIAALASCRQGVDIQNFDEETFKDDTNGCSGMRTAQKQRLFEITGQFKGLTQTQIKATLGKPDRQELAERNQKYFIYFIEPSPQCNDTVTNPLMMYIRFSAVNRSTEISFQNY